MSKSSQQRVVERKFETAVWPASVVYLPTAHENCDRIPESGSGSPTALDAAFRLRWIEGGRSQQQRRSNRPWHCHCPAMGTSLTLPAIVHPSHVRTFCTQTPLAPLPMQRYCTTRSYHPCRVSPYCSSSHNILNTNPTALTIAQRRRNRPLMPRRRTRRQTLTCVLLLQRRWVR